MRAWPQMHLFCVLLFCVRGQVPGGSARGTRAYVPGPYANLKRGPAVLALACRYLAAHVVHDGAMSITPGRITPNVHALARYGYRQVGARLSVR